jgi:predicted nucleic acid-binding protein
VALIVDTGVLYGAYDTRDASHVACAALLTGSPDVVTIPAPVLLELEWLLASRRRGEAFLTLLDAIETGAVEIADLIVADYVRARELCRRYRDLPLGFVDAAVVAVAERYEEDTIATIDHRHFGVVRPRHVASFALVP